MTYAPALPTIEHCPRCSSLWLTSEACLCLGPLTRLAVTVRLITRQLRSRALSEARRASGIHLPRPSALKAHSAAGTSHRKAA